MSVRAHSRNRALARSLSAVIAVAAPVAAHAQDGAADLLSAETLTLSGDLRISGINGEQGWTDGGFGKLRNGTTDGGRAIGELGQAALVWQPRLTWSLAGTVVVAASGGDHPEAGLSEAFLTFKPLSDAPVRFSARVGLMWPPVSLEHSGADWAVTQTVTPSAINSWISEEVKLVGAEMTGSGRIGEHTITATAAVFDANDTSGALLTFRGWAMHDRLAYAFHKQPLPPLNEFMEYVQPRYSHPVLEMDPGVLSRPGFYAKLAWDPPFPVHVEVLHYDNNGDPEAVNDVLEWGWRTRFDNIGLVAEPGPGWQLRAQAMAGRTLMGLQERGLIWIDTRFRSAYAMVTRQLADASISARIDLFGTRNRGSIVTSEDNEDGWAATVAARKALGGGVVGLVEYLHIESSREARARLGIPADQKQDQVQLSLRWRW